MPTWRTAASVGALLAATLAALSLLVAYAQPFAVEPMRRVPVTVEDRPATTVAHVVIEGALP